MSEPPDGGNALTEMGDVMPAEPEKNAASEATGLTCLNRALRKTTRLPLLL